MSLFERRNEAADKLEPLKDELSSLLDRIDLATMKCSEAAEQMKKATRECNQALAKLEAAKHRTRGQRQRKW